MEFFVRIIKHYEAVWCPPSLSERLRVGGGGYYLPTTPHVRNGPEILSRRIIQVFEAIYPGLVINITFINTLTTQGGNTSFRLVSPSLV